MGLRETRVDFIICNGIGNAIKSNPHAPWIVKFQAACNYPDLEIDGDFKLLKSELEVRFGDQISYE